MSMVDTILARIVSLEQRMEETMATKDDLHDLGQQIFSHIDGLVKRYLTVDHETTALRSSPVERYEVRITNTENYLGLN